ncbi:MAG: leucine-rich repeat protein, partial [Bacteroidales bacterium]|nr:leucine-rich repeat protein [Bacteroidales bacterium]
VFAGIMTLLSCSTSLDEVEERLDKVEARVAALEKLCSEMNSNISSLRCIVQAVQNGDYITSVTPLTENGKEVGYTINFSKGKPITVYHGKDGANGKDGKDGQDGKDGEDGKDGTNGQDGHTPVIGVKQDTDGIWYWTIDGEWLLDSNNQKVKAVGLDGKDGQNGADGQPGSDGKDGQNGQDGKDGITPQLKIEDGYWYVSTDNGATWTQLGKATGENGQDGRDGTNGADGKDGKDGKDGDSMFQSVNVTDTEVTFVTSDGQTFVIRRAAALSIEFDSADLVVMGTNATRDIHYTITSGVDDITIEALSSADIKVKVNRTDAKTGSLQVVTGATIDEYSKVVVLVNNGSQAIMRTLTFEEEAIKVEEDTTKEVTDDGGEVTLEFFSNVPCQVVIPEDAQSWISVAPETKAMEKQTIDLIVKPNEGLPRSATVNVVGQEDASNIVLSYTITQEGFGGGVLNGLTVPPDNEIWYRTADNKIYDVTQCEKNFWLNQPFNVPLISNTYENGFGIIKCDGPIICLNSGVFYDNEISELYLPDCVERLGICAIYLTKLKSLRIPANLNEIGDSGLIENLYMEKFSGAHVSEDGRCVIIDGTLHAFAGYGIMDYTIPQGVKEIAHGALRDYHSLESVVIPEGVETIRGAAFWGDSHLNSVFFPSSLKAIEARAFTECSGITGFYGNDEFHTPDNRCLLSNPAGKGKWVSFCAGKGLIEYSIPEGIVGIEQESFAYCEELKALHLPNTLEDVDPWAFGSLNTIEAVYGSKASEDHKCIVIDGNLKLFVGRRGITHYSVPESVTKIDLLAFARSTELKELTIGDSVVELGSDCFSDCPNLETIILSANLKKINSINPFGDANKVYCRSLIPPYHNGLGDVMHSGTSIYVPEQSLSLYKRHPGWALYKDSFIAYNYNDLPSAGYYISSDYTKDGEVIPLQTASIGNGIDIVLMGDAFSDRQITSGHYRSEMEKLYSYFFSEEPYKTYKDCFNVYYINVVSATEGYDNEGAALFGYEEDGGLQHQACIEYARKAVSEDRMDEATIIVGFNSYQHEGYAFYYTPEYHSDYGSGLGLAFFSIGESDEATEQLLHHEACGHAFAKLADEYENTAGPISEESKNAHLQDRNNYGWYKNIDFTNDPHTIIWHEFLSDERYADEGVGIYEGGNCFEQGVWRPTDASIMRYNTGGFNAPSRYAIWYRIGKLAYGESWEGGYEDFVAYDAINRTPAAVARRDVQRRRAVQKPLPQLPPPVVVGHGWREELQKRK